MLNFRVYIFKRVFILNLKFNPGPLLLIDHVNCGVKCWSRDPPAFPNQSKEAIVKSPHVLEAKRKRRVRFIHSGS